MSAGTASANEPSAAEVPLGDELVPVNAIDTLGTGWPAPSRTTPANRKLRTSVTLMVVLPVMVGMATSAAASPLPAGGVTRSLLAPVAAVWVKEPEVPVAAGVGGRLVEVVDVPLKAGPEQRAGVVEIAARLDRGAVDRLAVWADDVHGDVFAGQDDVSVEVGRDGELCRACGVGVPEPRHVAGGRAA